MQAVVVSDALQNLRVGIQNEALTTIYRITVLVSSFSFWETFIWSVVSWDGADMCYLYKKIE